MCANYQWSKACIDFQILLVTACLIMWGTVGASAAFTGIFAYWVDLYNYGALKNANPTNLPTIQSFRDVANGNLAVDILLLVLSTLYSTEKELRNFL